MIRLQSQVSPASAPSEQRVLESARAALMALDVVGLPAAALGRTGRPIAVNARFEKLIPDVARKRRQGLHLVQTTTDALFAQVLARLGPKQDLDGVHLVPIPAADGRPPMLMHLVSVRGAARDALPGVLAIVVVTPLTPKDVPSVATLQGLFQMTPAEARVARAVARRQTIGQIATSLGLSRETVRSQVKAALAKTGVTRKLDLAVMLAAATLRISPDTK
jgi:DNA-binding CsgD family transcriptional regulator